MLFKLWNKITTVSGELEATSGFLSGAIGTLPDGVTSVVAEDKKISDELLPGVTFNNKGSDSNFVMGSNIKFIGNCNYFVCMLFSLYDNEKCDCFK